MAVLEDTVLELIDNSPMSLNAIQIFEELKNTNPDLTLEEVRGAIRGLVEKNLLVDARALGEGTAFL